MPGLAAERRFAPGWPTSIFVMFFMPLLLGLGTWQLQRAEEKRVLQAQMDAGRAQLPISLRSAQSESSPHWRPVRLQGTFDLERFWLLDNRTRGGVAGVEVLQPFTDQSGQVLLVNRGWIAWPDRSRLPVVDTPAGEQILDAEILPPQEAGFTLGAEQAQSGWPKLVNTLDVETMSAQAETTLPAWTARLRDGSAASFRLEWPPLPTTASRHTGYAVQWFALAAALLILFIWAGFRSDQGDTRE
jgi:surfeit locus 1 family protein